MLTLAFIHVIKGFEHPMTTVLGRYVSVSAKYKFIGKNKLLQYSYLSVICAQP